MVEKSNSLEKAIMSAEQVKHEESSMETSLSQMATELKYHQRDIVAALILLQMANEDSGLLCHRSSSHGVKYSMKGNLRMRRETKGDRIGGGDSHSEVARKKAKFVAKRQQEAVGGQMNAADSVVLALSAMPCSGKRKHKKMNDLYEVGGFLDSHELANRLGVLREENVHVAGPVNIPRHMENDVREENGDDLHEMWQVLDSHEIADRWGNSDQKAVGAGLEDPHDKLGMLSIRKRKSVAGSYLERDAEDVAVPVKMPFKLAVPTVERLHPVGSPPAPPLVLMTPTLYKSMWVVGGASQLSTQVLKKKFVVAPIRIRSKVCLDHLKLKADRPWVVSINCLVRDAAARLPGGMGIRADICTLMRDSQYLLEDVTDEQLSHYASKGLNRLHCEVDPCVKYDGKLKVVKLKIACNITSKFGNQIP
ncbi:hypothetical protein ACLB2K_060321 [Fragaria x ananassa]